MPDFGFDGVSSSLAEFMSKEKSQLSFSALFLYYVRNPDTTDNTDSTRAAQGACYNQLATTLYTPAACQQSRKQHHTRAVVCPLCITAVASYLIPWYSVVGCFCYRTVRSVGLRVSAAV